MSLRDEFNKYVEQKKFSQLEQFVIKHTEEYAVLSEELYSIWKDLIYLYTGNQYLIDPKNFKVLLKIINNDLSGKYDEIKLSTYEILKTNSLLTPQEEEHYLKLLWDHGEIEKFSTQSLDLILKYFNSKATPKLINLVKIIDEKIPNWPKIKMIEISAILFFNDCDLLIQKTNEFLKMIDTYWNKIQYKELSRKEYYVNVFNILNTLDTKTAKIQVYLLFLKGLTFSKFNIPEFRLGHRDCEKLLICHENKLEALCVVLMNINNEKLRNEIVKFIKKNKDFSITTIKNEYSFCSKYFYPQLKINKKKLSEEFLYEKLSFKKTTSKIEQEEINKIFEKYNLDEKDDSDVLISQINAGVFDEVSNKKDLVVAFILLGKFNAANELLEKLEKNEEHTYMQCEILFRQKKFLDLISLINLNFPKNTPVEFLYLEAQAYFSLNKENIANKILKKILLLDPSFRLVKEKVKSA